MADHTYEQTNSSIRVEISIAEENSDLDTYAQASPLENGLCVDFEHEKQQFAGLALDQAVQEAINKGKAGNRIQQIWAQNILEFLGRQRSATKDIAYTVTVADGPDVMSGRLPHKMYTVRGINESERVGNARVRDHLISGRPDTDEKPYSALQVELSEVDEQGVR